jgi:hypothetical protein
MKKNLFLLLLLFLFLIGSAYSQNTGTVKFGESTFQEYFFAFKIMPSMTGELVQCAVVKKNPEGRDEITFMSKETWARQMTGYEASKANPNKENFVVKFNIFEIPPEVSKEGEEEIKEYTILKTVSILANLWRLRYSEYPYQLADGNPGKGWAANSDKKITWLPSESQMQILKEYGIGELSDFCYGEDAFKLLKDVRTKEFQAKYNQNTEPASIENGSSTNNSGGN